MTLEIGGGSVFPNPNSHKSHDGMSMWSYYFAHAPKTDEEHIDMMRRRENGMMKSDSHYHEKSKMELIAERNGEYADAAVKEQQKREDLR